MNSHFASTAGSPEAEGSFSFGSCNKPSPPRRKPMSRWSDAPATKRYMLGQAESRGYPAGMNQTKLARSEQSIRYDDPALKLVCWRWAITLSSNPHVPLCGPSPQVLATPYCHAVQKTAMLDMDRYDERSAKSRSRLEGILKLDLAFCDLHPGERLVRGTAKIGPRYGPSEQQTLAVRAQTATGTSIMISATLPLASVQSRNLET
jgi:hypothetical protein